MNIFKREIKAYWKSMIPWTLGITGLIVGGLSKYQGYALAGDETIEQLFEVLPDQLLSLFGGREADLTNILTFFAIMFLYLAILGAVHAALLGAGILTKEEQDKTTEFLYVKPITRSNAITQKLAASIVLLLTLNIIMTVLSIFFAAVFGDGQSITGDIVVLMIGLFFTQMTFLGVGMMSASITKNPKFATPIAAGIVLATFILSILIDIIQDLAELKYLTPFKYFDAKVIADTKELDPLFITISIVLIVSTIGATYFFYSRRDLNV